MNLKNLLISKGKETITIADRSYARSLEDYIKLQELKKYMTPGELEDYSRTLGRELGLICEYYLKGLLLPYLKLTIPESDECLKNIVSNLTDEQKYKLIIGDKSINDEIFNQYKNYGISKKSISRLQGKSLKEYSHYLKRMIGNLVIAGEEEHLDILPNSVKEKVYKEMRYYYYPVHLKQPLTKEELIKRSKQIHHEFGFSDKDDHLMENMDSVISRKMEEFEKDIADPSVSTSFSNGRYGHLDGYVPNVDALFYLAQGLRKSVRLLYPNAITIVDGYEYDDIAYPNCNDIRYIFPDENSKIYVVDGQTNEFTRIYSLKLCDADSTSRSLDKDEELLVVPEFGQIFMIKQNRPKYQFLTDEEIKALCEWDVYADGPIEPNRTITIYKDLKETKVIFTANNKRHILFYTKGKLISEDPAKEPWIEEAIELYENKNFSHKEITPFETLKNALTIGVSTYKTNEADNVEQSELNPENIKEGETKDGQ